MIARIAALLLSWLLLAPAPAAEAPRRGALQEQPASPEAAPGTAQSSEPPLDLTLLEKRLKETEAIGFFTKLTLKNEVDDLLERFRAHYAGRNDASLAELRKPYETLIFKVLSLLQDSDPSLAGAIAASREAIWAILSDPREFAKLENT
ncbi:MAG TPA: hypothetical protein VFK15_03385 [Burkholderiales bacterium]|nr:hypothetical protein [Burkholderiales bacterium]